jgi:predicted metal-dependent peptidase
MTITVQHHTALDNAKFEVFLQHDAAFLGSLMCSMDINWDEKIPTACTNGLTMEINPDWFMQLPERTRLTVLLHELWHIGYLHPIRAQGLDHDKFNRAADYTINIRLKDEGHSFDGSSPLLDAQYRGMTTEEVYALLPDMPKQGGAGSPSPSGTPSRSPGVAQAGCWSDDPNDMDMQAPEDAAQEEELLSAVHQAVIAQQRTGHSSKEVDAIAEIIRKRNEPKVDWRVEMKDFATEKCRAGLDYRKRNRRYTHVILPARGKRGRLTTLMYIMDVSGSVNTAMSEQMMSEIIYIWEVLKPKKLIIAQFDTQIRKVEVWTEGKIATEIEIIGRGGTSLEPVAKLLRKEKPTGAVIMTDLDCPIMSLVEGVPVLWLCINNPNATVRQGKLIHIQV